MTGTPFLTVPRSVRLFGLAAAMVVGTARADTIIVDSAGSGQATSIQAGISAANTGDTVHVLSGTTGVYTEAVTLDRDITLECEGPDLVTIRNSGGNTITINTARNVAIRGCAITGMGKGILIGQGVSADISNNVIVGVAEGISRNHGGASISIGTIIIRNNVVTTSSGVGIALTAASSCCSPCSGLSGDISKLIINNIVYNNTTCGIDLCSGGGMVDVEYNNVIGNTPGYCDNAAAGTGSVSLAPNFMSENTGDFRLSSNSTSHHVGKPGYNNPDGTRNDLGAYGGPDAAGFFPSPEGGPTIRTMSLSPGSVPKNGTITLQATGQVAVP